MSAQLPEPTYEELALARLVTDNAIRNGDAAVERNALAIAHHVRGAIEHDRRQSRAIAEGYKEHAAALEARIKTLEARFHHKGKPTEAASLNEAIAAAWPHLARK